MHSQYLNIHQRIFSVILLYAFFNPIQVHSKGYDEYFNNNKYWDILQNSHISSNKYNEILMGNLSSSSSWDNQHSAFNSMEWMWSNRLDRFGGVDRISDNQSNIFSAMNRMWDNQSNTFNAMDQMWDNRSTMFSAMNRMWNNRFNTFSAMDRMWKNRFTMFSAMDRMWNNRFNTFNTMERMWDNRFNIFSAMDQMSNNSVIGYPQRYGTNSTNTLVTKKEYNYSQFVGTTSPFFNSSWSLYKLTLPKEAQLYWNFQTGGIVDPLGWTDKVEIGLGLFKLSGAFYQDWQLALKGEFDPMRSSFIGTAIQIIGNSLLKDGLSDGIGDILAFSYYYGGRGQGGLPTPKEADLVLGGINQLVWSAFFGPAAGKLSATADYYLSELTYPMFEKVYFHFFHIDSQIDNQNWQNYNIWRRTNHSSSFQDFQQQPLNQISFTQTIQSSINYTVNNSNIYINDQSFRRITTGSIFNMPSYKHQGW